MRRKTSHIFKFKWWLPFITLLPIGAVGIYAVTSDCQISSVFLITLLIAVGLSGWVLTMYLSWEPHEGRKKSWATFREEFNIKYHSSSLLLIIGVLSAWLGIGTLLILLPHWVGGPLDGIVGGLIQFFGMCWIVIGLYFIMNAKRK